MTMVGDAYAAPLVEELRPAVLRPVVAVRHRHRRRGDQPETSTGAAGVAAADHHHQRLRLLGDRQHGLRPQPARDQQADTFELRRGRTGALRGLRPVPGTRRDGGRLGGPRQAGFRWATSTTPTPPARPFPSVEGQRVVISGDRGAHGCRWHAAAVRSRLAGRQHRRREGVRRRGRGSRCARTRASPTRWWSAGPASGGAKRSSRSWRCSPDADGDRTSCCTRTAHRSWRGSRRPKEFIFVDQVRRLGNGKADYRWAKSHAVQAGVDDMTAQGDRLPGQRPLRRDGQATRVHAQGARRLLQGPAVAVRPGRTVRSCSRRWTRTASSKAILMDNLAKPSVTARKFVEAAARPVRAGDGRGQPAAADARAARAQPPSRRDLPVAYTAVGPELLGRRHVPAERRRLLPALHEVRRARPAAVHQHRPARPADPR